MTILINEYNAVNDERGITMAKVMIFTNDGELYSTMTTDDLDMKINGSIRNFKKMCAHAVGLALDKEANLGLL